MRANLWLLALAGVIAVLGSLTYRWTQDRPPVPLLIALALVCFLDVSSLAVVLALRRRQLWRDRPSIPLAIFFVSLLVLAALWWHTEVFGHFFLYTFLAGSFHLLVFFLLALLLIPVIFRSSSLYFSLIERIGLFSVLLLLSGALANSAWMALIYDRLYFSQDTVVDFFPFIPFGQWVLDVKWGDETGALLGGASLWHVQVVWLLFALLAWGSAALAYRRTARLLAA
jgi:hypothetical protein